MGKFKKISSKYGLNRSLFKDAKELKEQLAWEEEQAKKIDTLSGKDKTQTIWEIACGDNICYWSDYFRDFIESEVYKLSENADYKMSDYDKRYPNNTYRYGFIKDGYPFVTGYTGIAGAYWQDQFPHTLCEADELNFIENEINLIEIEEPENELEL
ncbi:hypothetical protein [Eggerthia catenaformis]